jgi:hypothetical protein
MKGLQVALAAACVLAVRTVLELVLAQITPTDDVLKLAAAACLQG